MTDAEDDRRDHLVAALQKMSHKFNSFALAQLSSMAKQDPFAKIKGMINEMIEKLLNEANEEATHKAFCDEELSKSRKSQADRTMKLDKTEAHEDYVKASKDFSDSAKAVAAATQVLKSYYE